MPVWAAVIIGNIRFNWHQNIENSQRCKSISLYRFAVHAVDESVRGLALDKMTHFDLSFTLLIYMDVCVFIVFNRGHNSVLIISDEICINYTYCYVVSLTGNEFPFPAFLPHPRSLCKFQVISVSLSFNVRKPNRLTLSDCVISCICCGMPSRASVPFLPSTN